MTESRFQQTNHGFTKLTAVRSEAGIWRRCTTGEAFHGIVSRVHGRDVFSLALPGSELDGLENLPTGATYGIGTNGDLQVGITPVVARVVRSTTLLVESGGSSTNTATDLSGINAEISSLRTNVTSLSSSVGSKADQSVSITGILSLTGGGDLSSSRTLQLINDNVSPGARQYYGTDASGVKGWYGTVLTGTLTTGRVALSGGAGVVTDDAGLRFGSGVLTIDQGTGTLPTGSVSNGAVVRFGGANNGNCFVLAEAWSSGVEFAGFKGRRAGGTRESPLPTLDFSRLVTLQGYGYDGSTYLDTSSCAIIGTSDGVFSAENTGGYWSFQGTPAGSRSRAEWGTWRNGLLTVFSQSAFAEGSPSLVVQGNLNRERIQVRSSVQGAVVGAYGCSGSVVLPDVPAPNTFLGFLQVGGWNGTTWQGTAQVYGLAPSAWVAGSSYETELRFETTPAGSTERVLRGAIQSNGSWILSGTDPGGTAGLRGQTAFQLGLGGDKGYTYGDGNSLEIGLWQTSDSPTYIDFHSAEWTYWDCAGRLIRYAGENGEFELFQRGTGQLRLYTYEAAPIAFWTNREQRGLISSGGLLTMNQGYGSGLQSAPPATVIGQTIKANASPVNAAASGTNVNITSLTLTPGIWEVFGGAVGSTNGANLNGGSALLHLSTTSAGSGIRFGRDIAANNTPTGTSSTYFFTGRVFDTYEVTTNTVVYLTASISYFSGTPQWGGAITAVRRG